MKNLLLIAAVLAAVYYILKNKPAAKPAQKINLSKFVITPANGNIKPQDIEFKQKQTRKKKPTEHGAIDTGTHPAKPSQKIQIA